MVTPYGEIQWNDLSRISDPEMKALMIDVVDYCFDFLMELCSPLGPDLIENLKRRDELPQWNDPVPMIRRRLGRGSLETPLASRRVHITAPED